MVLAFVTKSVFSAYPVNILYLKGVNVLLNNDIWLILQGFMFFVGSVSDMGTFPPTLTVQEENELLAELAKGSAEAKRKLVEHNLRLVVHIAKRFANTDIDIDDLISIGTIGLIKAVDKFDPTKQARIATFASTCIENEILMTIRASKKDMGNVLLSDCLGSDDEGNEMVYGDILGAEDTDVYEQIESEEDIKKMCEMMKTCLSELERTVLELRYGLRGHMSANGRDGLTQQAVADRLNISRSYVSRIESKALNKLAKRFGLKAH